ncbi:MAG TPA: OmpA family protein [Polyangiales bacterium]|nr:OmpA family protein [Polyangiales bacterium]
MRVRLQNYRSIALCLAALGGCASAPPPRQLIDARAAYNEARLGKAAELAPAELHMAKMSLNSAEQAFQDDPESAETYTLSYVALRTAELVKIQAETKAQKADLDQAQRELDRLEAEEITRTRSELARTRSELASERQAREAAEGREREALQKLAQAAALSVKEEPRGTVIVLPGSVLFTSGEYKLTAEAQNKLGMIAETLRPQAQSHEIVVEGHTDSKGTPTSNQLLSENRARAVMEFLISRGVPSSAITSVGVGQVRPIADNASTEGRANNRRVEIIIKPAEAR